MRPFLAHLLVFVGAVVVSLVVSGSAFATSGWLTVTSNTTLSEDHYGSVWFAADSVTLDCAGHSLIGPGPDGWRVGIAAFQRSHVTIRNCHVQGFGHGISLSTVKSFALVGNSSSGNQGGGIVLYDATDGIVAGNVASANSWWGISGQNITDIRFVGNRASENGYDGFRFFTPWPQTHYSADLTIGANASTGNGGDGFHLDALADHNTLSGNVARDNTHGFMIGSSYNTLTLNVALSNHYTGFVTAGWPAPWFSSSVEPAVGNTLRLNIARGNGFVDAAEYNKPGTNTWQYNWFGTTFGI